jgi:hypothetical protein
MPKYQYNVLNFICLPPDKVDCRNKQSQNKLINVVTETASTDNQNKSGFFVYEL